MQEHPARLPSLQQATSLQTSELMTEKEAGNLAQQYPATKERI